MLSRREFVKRGGLFVAATAILDPVESVRRYWALDRTMLPLPKMGGLLHLAGTERINQGLFIRAGETFMPGFWEPALRLHLQYSDGEKEVIPLGRDEGVLFQQDRIITAMSYSFS